MHRGEPAAMMQFLNLDDLFCCRSCPDALPSVIRLDVMRVEEAAVAAHDLHLAALGHAGETAGELADDLSLVRCAAIDIDLGFGEGDAAIGHMCWLLIHHGGDVEQRLDGMQPTFRQTPPSVA